MYCMIQIYSSHLLTWHTHETLVCVSNEKNLVTDVIVVSLAYIKKKFKTWDRLCVNSSISFEAMQHLSNGALLIHHCFVLRILCSICGVEKSDHHIYSILSPSIDFSFFFLITSIHFSLLIQVWSDEISHWLIMVFFGSVDW